MEIKLMTTTVKTWRMVKIEILLNLHILFLGLPRPVYCPQLSPGNFIANTPLGLDVEVAPNMVESTNTGVGSQVDQENGYGIEFQI